MTDKHLDNEPQYCEVKSSTSLTGVLYTVDSALVKGRKLMVDYQVLSLLKADPKIDTAIIEFVEMMQYLPEIISELNLEQLDRDLPRDDNNEFAFEEFNSEQLFVFEDALNYGKAIRRAMQFKTAPQGVIVNNEGLIILHYCKNEGQKVLDKIKWQFDLMDGALTELKSKALGIEVSETEEA